MNQEKTHSAVILAAGNSSRMNYPKPFLRFDEESSFFEQITRTYVHSGIRDIVVVVNEKIEKAILRSVSRHFPGQNIQLLVNRRPERGRFSSLQLGLYHSKNNGCFIQNIDNPFISEELLLRMMDASSRGDYVVPVYGDKTGHPVIINAGIRNYLLSLNGDDRNLRVELDRFERIKLPWKDRNILIGINTAEEYQKHFYSGNLDKKYAVKPRDSRKTSLIHENGVSIRIELT